MKTLIRVFKRICNHCHGMKVLELPNGDTVTCPVCKGKGLIE